MDLLVENAIHRVYVVDEQRHPIGIITATDILRTLLHVAT
jgi:CBS domain-containing protein